jgi:hypothetical protein
MKAWREHASKGKKTVSRAPGVVNPGPEVLWQSLTMAHTKGYA